MLAESKQFPTLLNEWSMDKVKEVVHEEVDEKTAELLHSQGIDGKALQYLDDDENLKKFKLDHVQYLRLKGLVDKLKREMEAAREEMKWEIEVAREEKKREMQRLKREDEVAREEKKRERDRENKKEDDDMKRESKRKDDEEKRAERKRQEDFQEKQEMKTIFVMMENGKNQKSNYEICIRSQEELARFFGGLTINRCLAKMRTDGILTCVSKFSDLESGEQYIFETGPTMELEIRVLELQLLIRN